MYHSTSVTKLINDWLDNKGWTYVLLFVTGFSLGYVL